ncbi:hypothetical protein [Helicobacter typhlonius]|uniref:hypothetical protein n=1 Tax=Helicobacter typhlonius TaxID=76936 RepID=UPI002FE3720A
MKHIFLHSLFLLTLLNANNLLNDFSKYPAQIYQGKHKISQDYKCANTECRDINGKLVDLKINFAGKYSIIPHSCGTGCRFYSLLDKQSGNDDYMILSRFNTTPDTNNKDSIDILLSQKDSNLLIAQYEYHNGTCKQEKFIFDGKKLKFITKVLESCNEQ